MFKIFSQNNVNTRGKSKCLKKQNLTFAASAKTFCHIPRTNKRSERYANVMYVMCLSVHVVCVRLNVFY